MYQKGCKLHICSLILLFIIGSTWEQKPHPPCVSSHHVSQMHAPRKLKRSLNSGFVYMQLSASISNVLAAGSLHFRSSLWPTVPEASLCCLLIFLKVLNEAGCSPSSLSPNPHMCWQTGAMRHQPHTVESLGQASLIGDSSAIWHVDGAPWLITAGIPARELNLNWLSNKGWQRTRGLCWAFSYQSQLFLVVRYRWYPS